MKLLDLNRSLNGIWTMTAYEGDVERNDDGRILNPVVFEAVYRNLITNVGKAQILNRLFNLDAAAAMANIGVGTSSTAAAVGNTTLTGGVYKAFDATPAAAAAGSLSVTATTTYLTSEANISINEAAVTTGAPGVILNRLAPIGPFAKTSAVSLAMSITITQS
jgi:hypothetical protein